MRLAWGAALVASSAAALSAALMGGLAAAETFAAAATAFVGLYMIGAIRSVAESELLHERVPASRRATMVSVQSLSQQSGGLIASLGLTRVAAAASIPAAWGVGAALLVLAAALLLLVQDTRSDPLGGLVTDLAAPHSAQQPMTTNPAAPTASAEPAIWRVQASTGCNRTGAAENVNSRHPTPVSGQGAWVGIDDLEHASHHAGDGSTAICDASVVKVPLRAGGRWAALGRRAD